MRFAVRRFRRSRLSLLCLLLLATVPPFSAPNAQTNEPRPRPPTEDKSDARPPRDGAAKPPAPAPIPDAAAIQAPAKPGAFEMSAVERLRLRVPDHADLTGEYSVDADASISLPGLGRMRIAGMSPEALEKELARRASSLARRDLTVSVEIERFKPYFIVGMISEPSSGEWRPGLNVLKAIALAGGTVRPPAAADDPTSALAMQQSQLQLQFALALIARLKAERDGSTVIEPSDSPAAKLPTNLQPRLKEFMARQNAIIDEQRETLQSQVAGFERDREAALSELAASQQQEKVIKVQLEISQSLLSDVEQLKDQKLVSNSRYLSQRSELLTSQVRYAEAQSMTERSRTRADGVSRQIEALVRERKTSLNERIELLHREVAQLEVALLPAQASREASGQSVLNLTYHIARETASGTTAVDATLFSEIRPGDVIVVSPRGDDITSSIERAPGAQSTGPAIELQRAIEASSASQSGGGGSSQGGSRSATRAR